MAGNPFEYINNITSGRQNMIRESDDPFVAEKEYPAFMANRGLSYFIDTIMYANDMNRHASLDGIMQYEYLYYSVPKKKRFTKWSKPDKSEEVALVSEYYGYSKKRAEEALRLLTPDQLTTIRKVLDKGGKS
jgi:Bacteriophage clamp loader A subunit